MPAGDFILFRNLGLSDADTSGQTSTVGEPSIANNGREIFVTGNWYATRSLDNGATWDSVSPFNALPPVSGGFCCDQITHYDPSRDLTFWLLQYVAANNTNTLRLAVKRGATLGNNVWHWWDFRPDTVDATWTNVWFDYPDLALSNDYLYVTSNVFTMAGAWTRAVVLRLALDELEAGGQLSYTYWSTIENGSLRCTQGARDTMYFASHQGLNRVKVWTWPESSNQPTFRIVNVSPWNQGAYVAAGPDGNNWLSRADGRITGAWVASGVIGFMWSANSRAPRPRPHVRVVRLREDTQALIDEPDIWSTTAAYAYPAACPNDRGHVGIALFTSSATSHPTHVVGILDDFSPSWSLQATRNGTNGSADGKWGDYLSCRRHSPDGLTWMATGFTLQGGSGRSNIEPRVVHFGRQRDTGAVNRWRAS